jgi:hypothetical protein
MSDEKTGEAVEADGRSYPVTRDDAGQFLAADGSNEFKASTLEGLRESMKGIAGNPNCSGNTIAASYNIHPAR